MMGSLVGDKKMGDLKRHVFIPAVDLTAGSYRIFRSGARSRTLTSPSSMQPLHQLRHPP